MTCFLNKITVVIESKVFFGMKNEDNFNKEIIVFAKTRLIQSVNYQLTVFGTNKEVNFNKEVAPSADTRLMQ